MMRIACNSPCVARCAALRSAHASAALLGAALEAARFSTTGVTVGNHGVRRVGTAIFRTLARYLPVNDSGLALMSSNVPWAITRPP